MSKHKVTDVFSESELTFRLDSLSLDVGLDLRAVDFIQAMIHRSFVVNEASEPVEDLERLEFLGDSVANMIVSQYLYTHYPEWAEGQLSQAKAILISSYVFAECGKKLKLDRHIILSDTEQKAKAYNKTSVLEDVFEAFMGALFIHHGQDACQAIMQKVLIPYIPDYLKNPELLNGKSLLMEYLQKKQLPLPIYRVVNEEGLDHDKTFEIEVQVGNVSLGSALGSSKKKVEKQIALSAYFKIMENPEVLKELL